MIDLMPIEFGWMLLGTGWFPIEICQSTAHYPAISVVCSQPPCFRYVMFCSRYSCGNVEIQHCLYLGLDVIHMTSKPRYRHTYCLLFYENFILASFTLFLKSVI